MEIATIVTGYFQLEVSKASDEKYKAWMKNMLAINNPMVIFCDETSYDFIADQRSQKKEITRIVVTKITDFYSYKYVDSYNQHYYIDVEKSNGHTPFLYMIWAEKSHFLKRAIDLDPFRSEYFLWVDIGCFRVPNTEYLNWPNPEKVPHLNKEKVLLLSVVPFTENELLCFSKETLPLFQFENRIGGTMFGGGKDVLLKWHALYYNMLEYFISIDRFIGKDQSIMNSVYLLNRDVCDMIHWVPGCRDPWFYIQEYLI